MKVSKALVALSLIGSLASFTFADDIDSEIAKLKKENELLELQKKNQNLKKGSSSSSRSQDGLASELTGWFVGAELGWNPSVTNYMKAEMKETGVTNYATLNSSTYALPINLGFGYQWYPWDNAGFKFRGYVGYASYNSKIKDPAQDFMGDQNSQAIHYGLEAEYLYDFIASQTHTFGLNIGTGYEFGNFFGQKQIVKGNGLTMTENLKSYTSSSWTSSIGIHYFYNINHQFELKYRYRSGYTNDDGGKTTIDSTEAKYASTPKGSIIFAYNYKF